MNQYNEFVSKYQIRESPIYVKVSWKENRNELFELKIYAGNICWLGSFSYESSEKYREIVDESKEEYYRNVKQCLIGKSDKYIYDFNGLNPDVRSAAFSWKRKFEGSTAIIVHGSLQVHRDDSGDRNDLLNFLLDENNNLRDIIHKCNHENETLSNDLQICKVDLDKFANVKSSLESSLYGKFMQLLNTKKKRIQILEEHLQRLESSVE